MYKPEVETAKAYTIGLIKSAKKPVIKVISSETSFNVVDLSMFLDGRYQYWNNIVNSKISALITEQF